MGRIATLHNMNSDPLLRITEHDSVVQLTMSRPPANALGPDLIAAFQGALDHIEEVDARAVVIDSAVPGFFAAGADIKHMGTLNDETFAGYRDELRGGLERLAGCGRPTIAAIDGRALGGGLELAMACTLRLATPGSSLGLPEIKLGLIPGAGGTQRLTRLVGRGAALEMMLTARSVDGVRGAELGLVDRLVDGDVTAGALALAGQIAGYPAAAAESIIRCVDAALLDPAAGMAFEGEEVVRLFTEGHADAAFAAFIGKSTGRS